jgi:tetratricopeptide (TPR) repeat protein
LALERGQVLLGQGHVEAAAQHFDEVAARSPWAGIRRRALKRSAALWALELDDPSAAKVRWTSLVETPGLATDEVAHAWSQIGHLELTAFDAPLVAAEAFEAAFSVDRDGPHAANYLADAAQALERAGEYDRAHQMWDTSVRRFSEQRSTARTRQASILLSKGRVGQALELYEDAIASASNDLELDAARRGAAACKERQSRVEAALAEIEAEELDDALLELREAHLDGDVQRGTDAL